MVVVWYYEIHHRGWYSSYKVLYPIVMVSFLTALSYPSTSISGSCALWTKRASTHKFDRHKGFLLSGIEKSKCNNFSWYWQPVTLLLSHQLNSCPDTWAHRRAGCVIAKATGEQLFSFTAQIFPPRQVLCCFRYWRSSHIFTCSLIIRGPCYERKAPSEGNYLCM